MMGWAAGVRIGRCVAEDVTDAQATVCRERAFVPTQERRC